MKITVVFLTVLLSYNIAFAQSAKYEKAMMDNIALLDSAPRADRLTDLANKFERIGEAEKNQWLPYYYASYCTALTGLLDQDKSKTDGIADKAAQLIKKAEDIAGKENSEICVIKSMIASSHLMVDPQNRWQEYGQISGENIAKAKALDSLNPRPVFLEGQAKFYTPEAFGGGKAAAKPYFEKALAMFATFKPETALHPNWGKAATEYFLSMSK